MQVTAKSYQRFNDKNTLMVVSSFPLLGEEIAKRNAVARYTHLLLNHFPKQQKVVVVCEQVEGENNQAYFLSKNILVIPSYQLNSFNTFRQLNQQVKRFNKINNILLQFEFSLFGKEVITFLLPFFFLWQRLMGKKIYTMFHQVVLDLSTLSGQVNLEASKLKTKFFNFAMQLFYIFFGLASEKVLVHDQFLAEKLKGLVVKHKLAIIPHGINDNKTFTKQKRQKIKENLGLKANDKVILAYGYHSWYKGTDWLVKSFLKLKNKGKLTANTKLLLSRRCSSYSEKPSSFKKILFSVD